MAEKLGVSRYEQCLPKQHILRPTFRLIILYGITARKDLATYLQIKQSAFILYNILTGHI